MELLKQENSQLQQRLSQCGYENTVRTYECKVLSRRLDEATSRAKHAEASAVILGWVLVCHTSVMHADRQSPNTHTRRMVTVMHSANQ